jgi:GntR family transcriptional regulator/MocR family aminotransferase
MRLRYAQRRDALLDALARFLPDWEPSAIAGGLHLIAFPPAHIDEAALISAAARQSVGIEGLSLHSYTGNFRPGLVLGHAQMAEPAIKRGVQLLASALDSTPNLTARWTRHHESYL